MNNNSNMHYKCKISTVLWDIARASKKCCYLWLHSEWTAHPSLLSVLRQLICINFSQSASVHCVHFWTKCSSIRSSLSNPKQAAHSLLDISASCSQVSTSHLLLLESFSLLGSLCSASRCLSAFLAWAFLLLSTPSLLPFSFSLSAFSVFPQLTVSFLTLSVTSSLPFLSSFVPLIALLPSCCFLFH